jgi:hypothetical protein
MSDANHEGKPAAPATAPNHAAPATAPSHAAPATAPKPADPAGQAPKPKEVGGPAGPEPTRYGDWERKGRVSDF